MKQALVDAMEEKDMPRRSVICRVADEQGVTRTEAERIVRSVLEAVASELSERGRFHVAEIGSIRLSERAPRRYFNPRTKVEDVSRGDVVLKINISKKMRRRVTEAMDRRQ